MPTQIKLPSLGENVKSGDVLSILVSEGDVVTKDQDLIEIETDKATMPVPSPEAGKVVKILVSEGETLNVGAPFIELESSSNGAAASAPAAPAAEQKQTTPPPPPPEPAVAIVEPEPAPAPTVSRDAPAERSASAPAPAKPQAKPTAKPKAEVGEDQPGDGQSSAAAGPAVRRLARELGVDLRRVRPKSGDRLTEDDVRDHVRRGQAESAAAAPQGATPPGSPDSDSHGAVRREKMSRFRQTIARNMLASYQSIPQLTNFDDVDVTELDKFRQESAEDYASQGIKLTTMSFIVKACASALKIHPIVNASVSESGEEILYKEYVNIGIAVDTPKGLVVPVLRDADRKSIPQIAKELMTLAEMARGGSFTVDDLRGGTFTISNLGAVGGTYSTPIINPPEAAILLGGRARMMAWWTGEELEPRLILPLSLTYDHRIVDGAAAARFLNDIKGRLANPGRLLLAP